MIEALAIWGGQQLAGFAFREILKTLGEEIGAYCSVLLKDKSNKTDENLEECLQLLKEHPSQSV